MFKIHPIALVAALFGPRAAVVAQATGCHPTYVADGDYSEGDWASIVSPVADEDGTERMARINYECVVGIWCKNVGYAPGSVYSSLAWTKHEECDDVSSMVGCQLLLLS